MCWSTTARIGQGPDSPILGSGGIGLTKLCNGDLALDCIPAGVVSDSVEFKCRFGREITLSAVGAADDRNVFYHEQISAFTIAARDVPQACSRSAAEITLHFSIPGGHYQIPL